MTSRSRSSGIWIALALVGALPACLHSKRPDEPDAFRRAAPTSDRPSAPASALEQEVFERVNQHRRARGLKPLVLQPSIGHEARRHSAAMAARSVPFGHRGFADRVEAAQRATSCRLAAENVAFEPGHRVTAPEAVRGWIASRPHRTNIEGPYESTGVGVASSAAGETYFTQIFVGGCDTR